MTTMKKPNRGPMMSEGRAARTKAMEDQGSSRIGVSAWYPYLEAFRDRGWKIAWIADACSLSERQVRRILQSGRALAAQLRELPVDKDVSDNDAKMLEFSAAGFEAFFNRFSGKKLPTHALQWVQEFIDHRNLMLNVPPRHAKTAIMAIWLPVWLLCINRNEQILIVSQTQSHAINVARSIAAILETNADLISAFGRFAPDRMGEVKWAPGSGELMILGRTKEVKQGDLTIQSRGMEQQILGMEATVVICDDPTNAKIAKSPAQHEEEMRKFREEVLSRIEPATVGGAAGRALVIGQRVAMEDLYYELKEQVWHRGQHKGEPLWYVVTQKMLLNDDFDNPEFLWPTRFDKEELEYIYGRFGESTFETMFQQNPRPTGEAAIKQEWVDACKDPNRDAGEGFRETSDRAVIPVARVLSIDPSPSEWNASIVADVANMKGNWYCAIVEVKRWKGRGTEFKQVVEQALDDYTIDYIVVEESTFLKWFTEDVWFEELSAKVKVLKHHTGINKNDLELGADSLAIDFEMGLIGLPWKGPKAREQSGYLITEALQWPLSRTFDVFMALWFIKWNRKKLKPRVAVMHDTFAGTVVQPNAAGRAMQAERDRNTKRTRIERLTRAAS